MNYHVLTLFPEMILQGLNTSIIGRAIEKGILSLEAVNIRDYAGNRYGKVDDYPYRWRWILRNRRILSFSVATTRASMSVSWRKW